MRVRLSRIQVPGMLPCDLFNRLSHHYIRFVERESRARGNTRNRERKPGLRYFRESRVNFRSDSEHRGSRGSRITDVIIRKKDWNY